MAQDTVKARIRLKSDTEANWNKALNFIPLKGEVIVYSTDESHPFSRLKVGDGMTPVVDLPFIGAQSMSNVDIKAYTKDFWDQNRDYIPKMGEIAIYLNYKYINKEDGSQIGVAGLKIGDGKTYLIDLPFLGDVDQSKFDEHIQNTTIHITQAERDFWNNKLNCENMIIEETLFLNRN